MTEFINNFHFLRPWFLLLAVIPLIMYKLYNYGGEAQSSWRKVIDERLLDFLLVKGSSNKRKTLVWSSLLGLILSTFIIAGPTWEKIEIPVLQSQNPVVIMLNLSSDMEDNDIKPNRLERAKYKIKDLLEQLHSTQTALGVYSSEPFIIAPFSDDMNILQNLLPKISFDIMPANGDRLDRAINLAAERIKEAGYDKGNLIIFTADIGQKFDLAIEAAKNAAAKGISVNIIEVSAESNEKLKLVSSAGNGTYWNIQRNDAAIDKFAQKLSQTDAPIEQGENMSLQWLDGGWYFLVIPLVCCLVLFRRGFLILVLFLSVSEARAGFFTNNNQDGLKAFKQQNYVEAANSFKNDDWKAASFYRQGNYGEALKYYTANNSVEGLYNQGNALAKSGKIKEAIAKYEEVLNLQPNHEDAKFNLEYLKQQQQQQQQQQNQSSQNKNSDNSQQSENQDQNDDNNQGSQNSGSGDENNQDQEQNQDENQQSQDNDQGNKDNQSGNENQQEQNQENTSPSDGNNQDNAQDKTQNSYINEQTQNEPQTQGEQEKSGQAEAQEGENEDYDEKVQAKMQRYREIPEDPGGLLRAFIIREYQKNRYNEK